MNTGDLLNLATLILFCGPLAMVAVYAALQCRALVRYA
jgi:hypothetical protein